MDTLTLKGLSYTANHGYYEQERRDGNDFEVDLIFKADLKTAGQNDNLRQTLDYQEAEKIVRQIMTGPSVKLIETLTIKIGDALFEAFPASARLEVVVRKLNPPLQTPTTYSEVRMSWQR